jgi:hypothetical protein
MGLVVGLILVAACCSVQLMWTLQRLFVTDEMTVLLLNMAPEEHQTTFPANTHWDNVQYRTYISTCNTNDFCYRFDFL